MCDASTFFLSRRAIADEVLAVTRKSGIAFTTPVSGDVVCACLKTSDVVQFCGLPESFQIQHAVGPNAVATFEESFYNGEDRDHSDMFDFGNTVCVALADMPEGATMKCLEIDGKRAVQLPTVEIEAAVAEEDELVLVPVAGNRQYTAHQSGAPIAGNRRGSGRGVRAGVLLMALVAIGWRFVG